MLKRMSIAAGTLGVSLAFAGTALAAPSPAHHGRRHVTRHHVVRATVKAATTTGAKLYVNGDTGNDGTNTCRRSVNPCQTISHAISVAPSTGTIEVAGGDYPEQLNVTGKNLTINGAGQTRTFIDPSTLATDTNDPNSSNPQADIVEFNNTTGGGLRNVTVDGGNTSEPDNGS